MIPQRNISLLSNRLATGKARRIPASVLERDYCLAWFLSTLGQSDLRAILAFKGGTALKRCYFPKYRFSEDLDFTLMEPISFAEILPRLEVIYSAVKQDSGITFAFDREDRDSHVNSHTFYLKYAGPLPAENDVRVDITIREHLAFPLEDRPILRGYEEFTDVPEGRLVRVYSLREIAAEKILALADRARNEPRDLYDLWFLITESGIQVGDLEHAIREKLAFRGRPSEGLQASILRKEARLKALWSRRLGYQMIELPEFDEIFRAVRRALRQAKLP